MKNYFVEMFHKDEPPIVTEKELLLVNRPGTNTWSVNFCGETESGEKLSFSYRLTITSITFGIKFMRMFDSLLTVTYNDELYAYGTDYGVIKKKQHVPLDYLFFMGNLSKIEGNFKLMELYGVMNNYEVDVRLSCDDKIVKKGFLQLADDESSPQDMLVADMNCSGRIRVEGIDHDVTGSAWVEKRYTPAAKSSGKGISPKSIKLWLFPNVADGNENCKDCENRKLGAGSVEEAAKIKQIAVYSYYDENVHAERVRALAIDETGAYECYDGENILENSKDVWESPKSGKHYPFPLVIKVPELELDVKVVPSVYEQEMLAENGVYSEYAGCGYYTGSCASMPVTGRCSMEIIGDFK